MSTRHPYLKDRLLSTFIDTLVIVTLMYIFTNVLDQFSNVPNGIRMLMFAFLFLYEPIFTSLGCTLGHFLMQIRVRTNDDTNKRINFFNALVRSIVKYLLGIVSFFTIHSNPQRRAIHDFASNSVMIKV